MEPRARGLGAIAIVLAVLAALATQVAGAGVWRALPADAAIAVVVAIPGILLGRTGLTTDPRTLVYEAILAAVAAGIVAIGVLAAISLADPTADRGILVFAGHVATTAASFSPSGIAGYVFGLASTLVD